MVLQILERQKSEGVLISVTASLATNRHFSEYATIRPVSAPAEENGLRLTILLRVMNEENFPGSKLQIRN